jgi:prepilin-type N-terminal cleavage/methylation domain-containing protein/prepilin-type processing-associated H-X9-DG protein
MSRRERVVRTGFTLVELLVVIAIMVLLISLLLPAIQKVREAANRMICASHLKQLAIAFHNYHNDYKGLPTAGNYDSGNPPTDRRDWGWAYDILPYIEQDMLWKNRSNSQIRRTIIKIYYCPSRREPDLYGGEAKTDYAGNGATRVNSDAEDGTVIKSHGSKNSYNRGPIQLSNGGIPDGTSNTILLGEKLVNWPTMGGNGQDWTDNESWAGPGFPDGDIMRGCLKRTATTWYTPIHDTNDPNPPDPELHYQFGSAHPLSMNAVFADGHTQAVRYGVDSTIFMRACVRYDARPFNLDDLQ